MRYEEYGLFIIRLEGNHYSIYDRWGNWLRSCKTKRECKERIDNQTV